MGAPWKEVPRPSAAGAIRRANRFHATSTLAQQPIVTSHGTLTPGTAPVAAKAAQIAMMTNQIPIGTA
jgi:hypothetical protein